MSDKIYYVKQISKMGEFFINFVLKTKIVMFGLCLAVENQIKPFKAILSIRV